MAAERQEVMETKNIKTYYDGMGVGDYIKGEHFGSFWECWTVMQWFKNRCLEAGIDESEISQHYAMFHFDRDKPEYWKDGVIYPVGIVVMIEGIKYRCRKVHTSHHDISVHMDNWELV